MDRRNFITMLSSTTLAWPHAVRAQQQAIPLIGFVSSRGSSDSAYALTAFHQGLAETGFIEGKNVAIEYRWAQGQCDRLPEFVADLVGRRPAVLVAVGGEPSALAAKAATSTIPIVFSVGGDPVKIGLVASISRPGGNATGVTMLTSPVEAKRFGLLHELAPSAGAIGVLINPAYQEAATQTQELQSAARTLGRQIIIAPARSDTELDAAFTTLVRERAAALLSTADPFLDTRRDRIVAFAAQHRLPAIYHFREYAVAGGLMSYGISITDGYRWVGKYAGQILKGTKPADLAIMQSVKFEHVINLKTAKVLGLTIPPMVLAQADEVIE